MIEELNDRFGMDDSCRFEVGEGGLIKAMLHDVRSTAEVYLHGAHVTSFVPTDGEPLLWMSKNSDFSADRPIRGGVPICWPWFRQPEAGPDQHGFARTQRWDVVDTSRLDDGVSITLQLLDCETTRALWPHAFQLRLQIEIGAELCLTLCFVNRGDTPMEVATALHTYYQVSDIRRVRVLGLHGGSYIDQLQGGSEQILEGDLQFDQEVDRIFVDSPDTVTIEDGGAGRSIEVSKTGSRSTVVWNPWIDKSVRMADFPDDGYRSMLCVETANAATDTRILEPGQDHTLSQTSRIL